MSGAGVDFSGQREGGGADTRTELSKKMTFCHRAYDNLSHHAGTVIDYANAL